MEVLAHVFASCSNITPLICSDSGLPVAKEPSPPQILVSIVVYLLTVLSDHISVLISSTPRGCWIDTIMVVRKKKVDGRYSPL